MSTDVRHFPCGGCGAKLEFAPGQDALQCPYCDHSTPIPKDDGGDGIVELDFNEHLKGLEGASETVEVSTLTCESCGAHSAAPKNKSLSHCPWCGAAMSSKVQTQRLIKPESLLPFRLTEDEAKVAFKQWLDGLSFAPSSLKQRARVGGALQGVYTPYWTFDCKTLTSYRGERGDEYKVTRTRTTFNAEGDEVEEEYEETEVDWSDVSGRVRETFDDVLVVANDTLPQKQVRDLEPWDLGALVAAREEYSSGFVVEAYSVDLAQGFERGKEIMDEEIREQIRKDIGGDRQRIHSVKTQHDDVSFKHILLPIWLCSYTHNDKTYRFIINARTGEVQGERPWSVWKILALVGWIMMSLFMLIPPLTPIGLLMILGSMAYGIYLLMK